MKNSILSFFIFLLLAVQSSAQSLVVHPGTCLKIGTASTLDISAGNLVLESDSLSTASLIDLGSLTYSGSGEIQVRRYITQGKWHFISAPVTNAEAGMFFGDYLQQHIETSNQWTDITSVSTPLSPMKGFSLWSTESVATTEVFSGISNSGTLQFNFSKGGNGFNLFGNPYPSAIDWDAINIPSGLNGQFYLWDPTIGANGDYVYYIEGGGPANTTTQFIPSGQGFFVEANAAGVLQLDNSARVHSTQNFYKSNSASDCIILKATGNGVTTQTAVRFNPSASNDIDRLLDVRKIQSGNQDIPNLYSYSGDEKMAINTLASVDGNEVIPMGFNAGIDGEYTIQVSDLELIPEGMLVILEDPESNQFQDLKKQSEYTFTYNSGNEKSFRLHLKEANGLNSNDLLNNPILFCNVSEGWLKIRLDKEIFEGKEQEFQLEVFSITGQQLMKSKLSGTDQSIPFQYSKAVYLVHINTTKGTFTTKVVNP